MTGKKIIRRPYVPTHGLQIRYTLFFLGFMFLSAAMGGYSVFLASWSILGEKLSHVYPQGQLIAIFQDVNLILLRNILIVLPLIGVVSIIVTQRIAGPMVRIKRSLDQLSEGNYNLNVHLRKGDEFHEIAESINRLAASLKKHPS
jgi:methyl-accepting chemotaxis protein